MNLDSFVAAVSASAVTLREAAQNNVEMLREHGHDVILTPDGIICDVVDAPDAILVSDSEYRDLIDPVR